MQFSNGVQGERAPAWHLERESISLYPIEFRNVPGEEFDGVVLVPASLVLALCHLLVFTILTIAALAQVLRHTVSMDALPACPLRHSGL